VLFASVTSGDEQNPDPNEGKIIAITDELSKNPYIPTVVEDSVLGGNIFNPAYPFDVQDNFNAAA
jgi:hypothetical protein